MTRRFGPSRSSTVSSIVGWRTIASIQVNSTWVWVRHGSWWRPPHAASRAVSRAGSITIDPLRSDLADPLDLDDHSRLLLDRYERKKSRLNSRWGCYAGRSRIAVLRHDQDGRGGCQYLGRCLWGCPSQSLYTPSHTLKLCQQFDNFQYVDGVHARHFEFDAAGRVRRVMAIDLIRVNRWMLS